jgi:hypothetical protein
MVGVEGIEPTRPFRASVLQTDVPLQLHGTPISNWWTCRVMLPRVLGASEDTSLLDKPKFCAVFPAVTTVRYGYAVLLSWYRPMHTGEVRPCKAKCCSTRTAEPYHVPLCNYWSGQRDSNPRNLPWQGSAVAAVPCPQYIPHFTNS